MTSAHILRAARLVLAAAFPLVVALLYAGGSLPFFAGISSLQLWWLIMIASGVSLVVATLGTGWQWTGIVSATLLVGVSSQLALTEPLWFQRIQIQLNLKFHIALLSAIAAQFIVALLVLLVRPRRPTALPLIGWHIRETLGWFRTVMFIVVLLATSITAMHYIANQDLMGFVTRLIVVAIFLFVNIATLVAFAVSLPGRGLEGAADFLESNLSLPGSAPRVRALDRSLPPALAIWVLIVSGLLCIFAFERMPHLGDELAYILQARYFSQGRLDAQIPSISLVPAFGYLNFDFVGEKWFSSFPPGWPLILSLGALFDLDWLVNPVLAAVSLLLAHALLTRETDRGTANLVTLLLAVSPWFLAMSASLMSHVSTLALWLAACLLLSRARPAHSMAIALCSGGLMGWLFLARPIDGIVIGTLVGLWALRFLGDGKGWRTVLGYGLGCLVIGVLVFPYNWYLTGDPFLTPIDTFFEKRWFVSNSQLGFGSDVGPPQPWQGTDLYPGHSPGEAAIFAQHNAYSLNFELFGWCIGSLFVFFFHVIWGRWSRIDRYMLAIIAATIGAYSFYWGSEGFHIGPRYWFIAFLPFVVITASGIETLCQKAQAIDFGPHSAQRLLCVLVILSALAIVPFLSWRATTKYYELRGFHADYRAMKKERDLSKSLIFIRHTTPAEIGSASYYNPTRLDSDEPIFVRDLGPESNRATAAAFPDRSIYFAVGRSRDGTKARIVEGPISLETLP